MQSSGETYATQCWTSVLDLQRVRYGSVELQDLPVGQTRSLTDAEMEMFVGLM